MAKTPPSRSYKLFSGVVCLACACAFLAPAKAAGPVTSANPATTPLLVMEVLRARAMFHLSVVRLPSGACARQNSSQSSDVAPDPPHAVGGILRAAPWMVLRKKGSD